MEPAIPAFVNAQADRAHGAMQALVAHGGFDIRLVAAVNIAAEVRSAVARGAKRIVIAGGDGTIGTAAGALFGQWGTPAQAELAILPAGKLNHFARDRGVPENLRDAVVVAAGPHARPVDLARVNDRCFLNTSSVGAYVRYVRFRERLRPSLGYAIASAIAGARLLARLPVFRVALDVEGTTREYLTPLVFIGVGERELRMPALGGRIPGGRRGLHVMVLRPRTGARALALALAAAARGTRAMARTPSLDAFLVERLRIEPRRPRRHRHGGRIAVSVDGEVIYAAPPFSYEIRRDVFMLVVPSKDTGATGFPAGAHPG